MAKQQKKHKEKKKVKPYTRKTIPFSRLDVQLINHLVNQGVFTSFSDCVRTAVREWVYSHMGTNIKDELNDLQGEMIFDKDLIKVMLSKHIDRIDTLRKKKK